MKPDAVMPGSEFAVATKLYYGALSNRLSGIGIERYFGLIYYLACCEKVQSQQEIAQEFRMDKTVLVRVIDYLEKKDFVKRIVNPLDRRAYFIHLTPLAREKLPLIEKAVNQVNSIAYSGMTETEIKNFNTNILRVKQNLSGEPAIDFELNYK